MEIFLKMDGVKRAKQEVDNTVDGIKIRTVK